jgi:hypothetical protein
MRLRLRQRWRLRRIGEALTDSDPWLAAWLAAFSRLAAGDAMPAHEQLGGVRAFWRND